MQNGGRLKFQLIGDDEMIPAFYHADQFEIVSHKMPSSWCVEFSPNNYFELAPVEFSGVR